MNSEMRRKSISRLPVSFQLIAFGLAMAVMVGAEDWSAGSELSMSLLKPRPKELNCVASGVPEGPRKMDPIRYQGAIEEARRRLLEIIGSFDRATVV